jgi:DNA-binding transcriptional LysR family regulator
MPAFSRFLRYFVVVGRLGSIRRAAEELNVSASAIDRQILNVEADLGMPLFERLPTGLRLTAAGEVLMAAGARWQKNLADVRAQIEDLRGLKRGHVEIAVIDALSKGHVPGVIQSIQSRYPGITVGIKVQGNDIVRRLVADGEVDLGIMFEPQSYRDLTVRAFVDVVLGLITPPGHPLARHRETRFSTCAGVPVIVPSRPLAVSQQIEVLEATNGIALDRRATSDNIQMIVSLVLQGIGIGVLTSLDVATEVQRGLLSFTRLSDPVLRPMTLALCTAAARTPSHAAGIVLGELEAGFAQLGYPAAHAVPETDQAPAI